MTNLNNKKLKKLLKSKSRVKIEQNPDLFYKEFLKSEVFVPVIAMENEESLSDGDTLDLQIGFFDEENGDRNIYLFTDTNELEKAGYQIKSIAVNVMELSLILAQFDIDFNYIVINPYSILYNDKLESLMKIQSEMSEEENEHFLNEFRKSELLVPLQIELDSLDLENMNLDGLNEINKEVKFHLKSFIGPNEIKVIPIFTDEENIQDVQMNTTVGSLFMRDLYKSILPIQDSFDQIIINPSAENEYKISIDEFLSLFDEEREFEDLMKEIEEEMLEDENMD